MATIGAFQDPSATPLPQPAAQTQPASYEAPNFRTAGLAGSEVQQAGQTLQQAGAIVAQANAKQDDLAAADAANKFKSAAMMLEQDPDSGYMAVKGQGVTAPNFRQNYTDQLQQAQDALASGLTNDAQRQAFQQHAQVTSLQFQSGILQHQSQQTTAFNQQTRKDTVDLAMNDIAAHPDDDDRFNTNMFQIGHAVVQSGQEMGLSGDALANYTKDGVTTAQSKALSYRTQALMLESPQKAADFFSQNELLFTAPDRAELAPKIQGTVDAQTSKIIGGKAFTDATAPAPTPLLPQDYNADFVKPLNQQQITSTKALVSAPSQYDALFQKYGQMYNVSPTELKLRAAVESGLNSNAQSPAGAVGLMQITPATAKTLGIDPTNPEQAIAGAAKLIAQAGGTVGQTDMSKVDRTYYGGNANAQGPNTDQYVANMATLRDHAIGPQAAPPTEAGLMGQEGGVIATAKAYAEQQRPGDAVYSAQVVSEAHNQWAQQLNAVKGQTYQTSSNLLGQMIGPSGAKSLSDLPPDQQAAFMTLPPEQQHSMLNLMQSNSNPKAIAETPENTATYMAMMGQSISDPIGFKNRNLSQDLSGMPERFRSSLLNQWTSIDKQAAQGAQVKSLLADPGVQATMDGAKIIQPSASTKNADLQPYNQFLGRFQQALNDQMTATGKAPTPESARAIATNLTATYPLGTGWFSGKAKGFQLTPAQEGQVAPDFTTDTGKAEQAQIQTAFQKQFGRPPSDAETQQAYLLNKLHPNNPAAAQTFGAQVTKNSASIQAKASSAIPADAIPN